MDQVEKFDYCDLPSARLEVVLDCFWVRYEGSPIYYR